MPNGSTAPITPAGNIFPFRDATEAALKRGGTDDALEALGALDQLRAAYEALTADARDLGVGLGNAISLVNVAALTLHH